jgi:hypothetical protein
VCSQNSSPWVPPCGVLIWGTSCSKGITLLHIVTTLNYRSWR